MNDKPKEEIYAERFDASKKNENNYQKKPLNSMKMKNLRKRKSQIQVY